MSAAPNSGQEGAASAAPFPTTPEDAERLLKAATSPAQAWAIYEISIDREGGWRIVKLKAERRYGELIGTVEEQGHTGRGHSVSDANAISGANRFQRNQARKVFAVDEEEFDAYLVSATQPTRAGLFRVAGVTKPRQPSNGKHGIAFNPEVIAWVAELRSQKKMTAEKIIQESGKESFPWHRPLSDGSLSAIDAILYDRQTYGRIKQESAEEWKPRRSGATSRLKVISSGRKKNPGKLWDLRYQLMKIVGWLSQLDLLEWGVDEGDKDLVLDLYDDLVMLDEWNTRALARAATYINDDGIREKIRKMKENQTGRTDAEKANIKRRITALERRLENKLSK